MRRRQMCIAPVRYDDQTFPTLTSSVLSSCSKSRCVSHLTKVLQTPGAPSAQVAPELGDARAESENEASSSSSTEAARIGEIAVLKFRLASCIDNKWETRLGEDASERLARIRACIANGRLPFTRQFADLRLTKEDRGEVEQNARETVEARIQNTVNAPKEPPPAPRRS